MTIKLANRVLVTTATTGTGTLTLGSAVAGYQSFTDGGIVNTDSVRYLITEGNAWEIGVGVFSAGTLTRVPDESSLGGGAISLLGNARVAVAATASDFTGVQPGDLATVATTGDYDDLVGKPTLGTAAALDVGTAAGEVVVLDGSARLPAVDGSQLTGLPSGDVVGPASAVDSGVALFDGTTGQLLKDGGVLATVALSGDYDDLEYKPTLGTAAALDVGTGALDVVQLDGSAKLPAVDGSQLTNLPVPSGVGDVEGPASSTDNAFAQFDGTTGKLLKDGVVAGTSANNLVQLDGSAKLPAVDGSQLTNLAAATGVGDVVGPASAVNNGVALFDGTTGKLLKDGGALATVATTGDYDDLSDKPTLGTAAALDVGTGALNVVQLDAAAKLPAVDGSQLTNLATATGVGDVVGPASSTANAFAQFDGTTGKLLKDGVVAGTSANNLVQLDGTAKLPAVDGSQLTNLAAATGVGDVVGPASATNNAVPQFDGTTGKLIKNGPTIGTGANEIVQLDGAAKLPAVDGSQLTNLATATGVGDVVGPASSTNNALAQYDGTTGKLLKDGPTIGTSANQIVQLDGSAKLPAVDGSQLTNLGAATGVGDVVGPSSAVNNGVALFDGTTGKLLKDGGTLATVATTGDYDDLSDKPTIPDETNDLAVSGDTSAGGSLTLAGTLRNGILRRTVTGNTTFTFFTPTETYASFVLHLINGGDYTVTWPASVDWPGGNAPALTSSGDDVLTFITTDTGTTWFGFLSGANLS